MDSSPKNLNSFLSIYDNMHGTIFTKQLSKSSLSKDLLESTTASIISPGPYYYFIFDFASKQLP